MEGLPGGRGARGAFGLRLKAAPGRDRLSADGELLAQKVGGPNHVGATGQHVELLLPSPEHAPRTRLCRGTDPGAPGSGREVAGGEAPASEGRGARRGRAARWRPTVRRGAGDTPAASASSPLVPGSVGRAVPGLPWARPLPLREEKAGEAPGARRPRRPAEPPAVQALKTSSGGAPVRRACRRPCPERRLAPARSAPRAPRPGP